MLPLPHRRYRSLAPLYYRGAHAGLIVYDITSVDSFQGAKSWATELKRKGEADCVLALVGSKVDLESDRQVDRDEAAEYARSQGLLFAEVSSKTGAGVQDIFVRLGMCTGLSAAPLPPHPPRSYMLTHALLLPTSTHSKGSPAQQQCSRR